MVTLCLSGVRVALQVLMYAACCLATPVCTLQLCLMCPDVHVMQAAQAERDALDEARQKAEAEASAAAAAAQDASNQAQADAAAADAALEEARKRAEADAAAAAAVLEAARKLAAEEAAGALDKAKVWKAERA